MKKIISLLLSVIFLLSFAPLNIFAMSGNGTESNPYLVSSASDINNIHNDLSGYYKLTCNIDMSGVDFEPIGNENEGAFTGTIDGNGYTIKNLNINLPDNKYVGFVGYLEGTVKNLNLENVDAYGYRYVGGIAGCAYENSMIHDCKVSGSIEGSILVPLLSIYCGGIVGKSINSVKECTNYASLHLSATDQKTPYYCGGIAGELATATNCNNYGSIAVVSDSWSSHNTILCGGIVGYTHTAKNCNNYGHVSSTTPGSKVGGIAGNSQIQIISCCNYGNVEGASGIWSAWSSNTYSYTAGITAIGSAIYCINFGSIIVDSTTNNRSCGYISGISNGAVKQSYNYGDVIGECIGGGISSNGSISNCVNVFFGKVPSRENINTLNGSTNTTITNCLAIRSSWLSDSSYSGIYSVAKGKEYYADFDFENLWFIDPNTNSGFPQLYNMPNHIVLNECVYNLDITETKQLLAFINGNSESVQWSISDKSVATISDKGIVSAKEKGVCTVTATNSTGMKAKCLINVYEKAASMKLSNSLININEDSSYSLSTVQQPSTANEAVTWHSENESIATVNQNGVVYGKSKGTTKIYAVTTQSNIRAECTVTVSAPISSIKLSSENKTLKLGASDVITATISPADYEGNISWESSDDSIVSVDSDGIIKANKIGTAYITATATSGVSAQCNVTVNQPAAVIKLNKSEITTYVGSTYQLSSSVLPLDTTDSVSWKSNNTSYATVSNTGLVTGVRPGSTSITARTSNGLTATCNVTIKEAIVEPTSVTLSDTYITLAPEDAKAINATIAPSNATETNLVWTSSDENVATVNNKGVVTAVSNGYATITAKTTNGYSHQCTVKVVDVTKQAFIAKSTKASAGEIAEYTVSVVKNPGISSYKLNLDYDSSLLIPIEIVKNPQISGSLSSNLKDEERSTLNVIWYSTDDFTENADLFTIKFKVADNAEYGTEIPITMSSGVSDIKNSSGKKLAFFMNNTSIKVEKPLLGDIFEDGEIDFRDLNLLARNVLGLESLSQRQLLAADTEQDKDIDTKDTVRLLQHLTGWTGADLIYTFAMNNSAASVKVGSASINAANEAEIPVSIENNPGVAGFRFELDYDKNAVDILSITPDAAISENFMTNLGTDEKLYVSWYNAENINADGALFTIKVKYKDECDKQVTPISIVAADNNMCNQKREDVIAEYETGYLMTDSFVKENESIENGTYSAELYFDNSYEEKSAVAILALYDKSGKLITLSSKDITVKPGKQNISVTLETAEFDSFKLFIWDNKITLKPLIKSK